MSIVVQDNATGNLTATANDNSRNAYTSPHDARKMLKRRNELKKAVKAAPLTVEPLVLEFSRHFVPKLLSVEDLKADVLEVCNHIDDAKLEQIIQRGVDDPAVEPVAVLSRTNTGEPHSSMSNVLVAVETLLANAAHEHQYPVVAYNSRDDQLWVLLTPPWAAADETRITPRRVDDADQILICKILNYEFRIPNAKPEQVSKALKALAVSKLDRYDPVVEYLKECRDEWTGTFDEARELLSTVLVHHAGAEDCPHTRSVTLRWFLAVANRALDPGCIYRQVLTLFGKQWIGKSTFFASLVPEQSWYLDDVVVSRGDANAVRSLRGKWIVELPEVDKQLKADRTGEIKSFISMRTDTHTPKYIEHAVDRPRDCAFGASTNVREFLHDDTGNSRFSVVEVGKIDHEAVAAARDRIWGAAMVLLLKAREQHWLTDEEQVLDRVQQEQHYAKPAAVELLTELVEGPAPTQCECVECVLHKNQGGGARLCNRWVWHRDQRVPEGYLRDDCVDVDVDATEVRLAWVGTSQLRNWLQQKGERATPQVIAACMRGLGWVLVSAPHQYRAKVGRRVWCHPGALDALRE
ncbi:MAG TPA: VapE domain-containing protein [Polyangiales bacterium]|nr:VapE domain-containing protein [Polyangiales bacterium]